LKEKLRKINEIDKKNVKQKYKQKIEGDIEKRKYVRKNY